MKLFNLNIYSKSIDELTNEINEFIKEYNDSPEYISCINPHSFIIATKDNIFQKALENSKWLLPDGIGIYFASNFLGKKIQSKITGPDFFVAFSQYINSNSNLKVYFVGSSESVLEKLVNRYKNEFPNIVISGTFSPPFKEVFSEKDNSKILDRINSSGADLVWVGMTAPKQEKWIFQNRKYLNIKLAIAIGAQFDFYSNNKIRAPFIIQKIGMEWLFRLVLEPKRLWKRTFVSAPYFVYKIFLEKLNLLFPNFFQR